MVMLIALNLSVSNHFINDVRFHVGRKLEKWYVTEAFSDSKITRAGLAPLGKQQMIKRSQKKFMVLRFAHTTSIEQSGVLCSVTAAMARQVL